MTIQVEIEQTPHEFTLHPLTESPGENRNVTLIKHGLIGITAYFSESRRVWVSAWGISYGYKKAHQNFLGWVDINYGRVSDNGES